MSTGRSKRGAVQIAPALVYFILAYVTVTVLAAALTEVYGRINDLPYAHELGVGILEAPAFVATVPYHVVIMLLVWPLFAWLYFRKRWPATPREQLRATSSLALLWVISAVVVDFVGFVLIENAWSLTPRELYVDYQPWITLIYLAIFASPWIHLALARRSG